MRCQACNRTIARPAYFGIGGYFLGPKCAQKAGKFEPKRNRKARLEIAEVQPGQMVLFDVDSQK